MLKYILALIVVCTGYLFYPTYDLLEENLTFGASPSYTLVEADFLTRRKCREQATFLKLESYRCKKKTLWRSSFSNYHKYNYQAPRSDGQE